MIKLLRSALFSFFSLVLTTNCFAVSSFDCPDLRTWHFVFEYMAEREYGQTHTDMYVANDVPTSDWVLKIRLPAEEPFITRYKSSPYWPSRFDMANFTWRYVYENAELIIDGLIDSAELDSKEENDDARVCSYTGHYGGNEVAMVAIKDK